MEIVGTYKLCTFDLVKDGVATPWGTAVHGLLIYTGSGHVSVAINKAVLRDESQSEVEDLFDSILFYAGTYQVEGSLVRHQVTEASNPARIGKEMLRYGEWNGSRLTLSTPEESFGRAVLVWEKIA